MSARRCTGHCCRNFTLPGSPGSLAIWALAAAKGRGDDHDDGTWSPPSPHPDRGLKSYVIGSRADMMTIGAMIRWSKWSTDDESHTYNCAHLRPNGDCGNYAGRPSLCQDYPYGRWCEHKACTLNEPPGECIRR